MDVLETERVAGSIRRLGRAWLLFLVPIVVAVACKPDLEGRASRIDGPRLLAVRSVPAEVETRDPFRLEALVVDPTGTTNGDLAYSFCVARKPLSELGSVSRACVSGDEGALVFAGATPTMPDDACRAFGPEVPPPKAGEDPGRPVDPDLSGGYYQPMLAFGSGDRVRGELVQVRIACGVFGATAEQSSDFRAHYHVNGNPEVAAITVDGNAAEVAAPASVAAGATVNVAARWSECPNVDACGDGVCGPDETRAECAADCATPAKTCTGSERYAYFDAAQRAVVRRREAIVASFYATAGDFAVDRSGRAEGDLATETQTTWTAPREGGLVHGWIVLRDDRGGVGWREFAVQVRP